MTSYATLGSNKLPEAVAFYDALLPLIGMTKLFDHPSGGRIYGNPAHRMFGVLGPHDGGEAIAGNGVMVGFKLDSRDAVAAFHDKAMALGGSNEGDPGLRGREDVGAYFAYFRDLDGNKLCAYCWG